jgi:hypothetical protein
VAKTVSKKNAHDSRSKGRGRGISNGFHASEAAHTARANQVRVRTLEPSVLSSNVCVEVYDQKRGLDWKVVNKFRQFSTSWVGESAARACQAHAFNVPVHPRPVKAKP